MKVVIVGAGPSGIVACKTLLENADSAFPFDPIVLEQESDIGGTFRFRSYQACLYLCVLPLRMRKFMFYKNAQLVSSKQLTSFSDFRLPLNHPDHLTLEVTYQLSQTYTLSQSFHRNTWNIFAPT